MLLTEEEAKEKWCHRYSDSDGFRSCIGDSCMAWRWHSVILHHEEPIQHVEVRKTGKGYCGLAGPIE